MYREYQHDMLCCLNFISCLSKLLSFWFGWKWRILTTARNGHPYNLGFNVKQTFECTQNYIYWFLKDHKLQVCVFEWQWKRLPFDTCTPDRVHDRGARWLSGSVSDSGARGRRFETYRRRDVSLSKTLYSPKKLVNYPESDGSVPTWLKNCWLGR